MHNSEVNATNMINGFILRTSETDSSDSAKANLSLT